MTFALRAVTCILIAAALLTSASVARVTPSDGARPAYRSQLWRMSGRLVARDGRAFSYAASFFRYAQPHGTVLCPASISILDESSGHVFQERRTERAGLGLADVAIGTLSLRVGAGACASRGRTARRMRLTWMHALQACRYESTG